MAKDRQCADEALLLALACGATVENAARSAGLSLRTAHRRLGEPGFRERVQVLRSDMVERAAGMLTAASLEAVKTLLVLQEAAQPAGVRLGAARTVLEQGSKLREVADLQKRLSAWEAKMLPNDPTGEKELSGGLTDEERTTRLMALLDRSEERRVGKEC